jgi:pimeloyl-ACP methyl ester carboxylesterase
MQNHGHHVVTPTFPGMAPGEDPSAVSLSDAVDHLVAEIERLDLKDIVLVAHDWSGIPVTAAANRLPGRIAKLIYWSAFVPRAGESLLDTVPAEDKAMLTAAATANGGHSMTVPFERWQNNFVQTASGEVKDLTYRMLRPQPFNYLSGSLSEAEAAAPDVPVTYLVSAWDRSVENGDEWWTPKYSSRLGVEPVMVDACHAAFFTEPDVIADKLMDLA